jgi:hypothetical protein
VPATYWLDLRAYQPVAVAAALGKPMLILQGGRDYQATVADDLAGWQAGLADRPDSVRPLAGLSWALVGDHRYRIDLQVGDAV